MSCPDCFSGFVHPEVEPTGREIKLHGLDTYVAEPDGEVKGIVVIVPDAFGWQFINNKVLADTYAREGQFRVYLPDFMKGWAAPVRSLSLIQSVMKPSTWIETFLKPYYIAQMIYCFVPFIVSNRFSVSRPLIQQWFADLRTHEGASLPIGAAGFCWGGKHVFKLAQELEAPNKKPLIDAAFAAHPSALSIPAEIEAVRRPISVANGDRDFALSKDGVKQIETLLKAIDGLDSEVVLYEGAGHGFAIRADPGNSEVVAMAKRAETQAVAWFEKCFATIAY